MPKIRQKLAELETLEGGGAGGMGGGAGKSMIKEAAGAAGIAAGLYGIGKADRYMTKLGDERREKEQREAAAEMKRETRGVEKTSTDRARETAAEMKLQERTNKAYEDASKNMKKGGAVSASKRADGIAQRGKTRGKMR